MCPTRAGRACRMGEGRRTERQYGIGIGHHPWEVVGKTGVVKPGAFLENALGECKEDAAGRSISRRQRSPTWIPTGVDRSTVVSSCTRPSLHADRAVDGDTNLTGGLFPAIYAETVHGATADSPSEDEDRAADQCLEPLRRGSGKWKRSTDSKDGPPDRISARAGMTDRKRIPPGTETGRFWSGRSMLDEQSSWVTAGRASDLAVTDRVRPISLDSEAMTSSMVPSHRYALHGRDRRQTPSTFNQHSIFNIQHSIFNSQFSIHDPCPFISSHSSMPSHVRPLRDRGGENAPI